MKKLIFTIFIIISLFPTVIIAEEIDNNENENEVITEEEQTNEENEKGTIVTLEKCIDGDTAKLKSSTGDIITYRLLAIDAPEVANLENEEEPFAREASKYTCDKLTMADEIRLEFDENANEKDEYDRGLAWVFVDDVLLQEELVSKGYAKVAYLYNDYKYSNTLKEKEEEAKEEKLGIWKEDKKDEDATNEEEIKQEKTTTGNVIIDFFNGIIENLVASFNNFVDSILQMIEDML